MNILYIYKTKTTSFRFANCSFYSFSTSSEQQEQSLLANFYRIAEIHIMTCQIKLNKLTLIRLI